MTRVIAFAAATLLWLHVPAALATTVLDLPVPELAKRSPTIIRGVVMGQKASWDAKHEHIVTRIKVRVDEVLRGNVKVKQQITIQQAGGEVGETGQHIEGAATFRLGEEVVLFLEPHRGTTGEHALVSLAASKFSVVRDNTGAHVQRDLSGLTFVKRDADGRLRPAPSAAEPNLSLADLQTSIREAVPAVRTGTRR